MGRKEIDMTAKSLRSGLSLIEPCPLRGSPLSLSNHGTRPSMHDHIITSPQPFSFIEPSLSSSPSFFHPFHSFTVLQPSPSAFYYLQNRTERLYDQSTTAYLSIQAPFNLTTMS
jgi:hypothetical protein